MNLQSDFATQLILGVISGILTVPILSAIVWGYLYYRGRHVRNFWRPFIGKKITIVMTEYPVYGDDLSSRTAKQVGGGYLVSRGNALAMANLSDFLADKVTEKSNLTISGDKSGTQSSDHLVIIGSPANNLFSQSAYKSLEEIFELPYAVLYDSNNVTIGFKSKDGKKEYIPKIENGNGVDYALIIRAKYNSFPPRHAIILSGAYMFGAQASSIAVTTIEIINHVSKISGNAENIAFLIRTKVINNCPSQPELEFEQNIVIHVLHPKKKQSGNR